MVIEGKFADHPQAREVVLQDARGRVRRGIANIAAAVVYPDALRTVATLHLLDRLEASLLAYCMTSEHEETAWFEGTPAALLDALRRTQETLAQDDLVARIARSLLEQLSGVALSWIGQTGACDRLSELLGMPAPKGETADKGRGPAHDGGESLRAGARQCAHLSGTVGRDRCPRDAVAPTGG